jgi:L-gulonate 3-dehydrogenase
MIEAQSHVQKSHFSSTSVAIIGAGLIGRAWAIVFARAGWQTRLYDFNADALDSARGAVAEQLIMLERHELCMDPDTILSRISYVGDLKAALDGVDYVQECGPEVLEKKRDLFTDLDQLAAPETILASSTSGFIASAFTEHLQGRHRALVVHPVNPPHLVPLVEVSPADWTAPEVTSAAHQIMASVNQTPITVQKEVPGFILNRLQGALLNEALRLAQGGYALPDDIDKVVRDGLGLRWSFMGPFETIDLNAPSGLVDYAQRYGSMYSDMAASQSSPPDWDVVSALDTARREVLSRDDIPSRQVWRDNRLAALIAHKHQQKD